MLKRLPAEQVRQCLAEAGASPLSAPRADYPDWYLHRWHFLPEGYLSRRSVTAYDRVVRAIYYGFDERAVLRRAARWLRAIAPERVVELGCGPGRGLEAIRGAVPAARIVGVDLSPFMLERAAARLGQGTATDLMHEDATALEMPGGSASAVVAFHLFGHLPEAPRRRALEEAARILRPGGWLIVGDHRWHAAPEHPELTLRRRARAGRLIDLFGLVRG